jgi:hypothetical protein
VDLLCATCAEQSQSTSRERDREDNIGHIV